MTLPFLPVLFSWFPYPPIHWQNCRIYFSFLSILSLEWLQIKNQLCQIQLPFNREYLKNNLAVPPVRNCQVKPSALCVASNRYSW
ncbi:hypothetical protein SPTER_41500 [Sporomusa termitida]|uniref:Uncharacterized protein n=1 Tax=Sporomusa termitida TaxID=2377 RepID=A0A517DZC5_9FIRM|nr:hypothetical protein SPTER_41500 [Sporomusa termitida]